MEVRRSILPGLESLHMLVEGAVRREKSKNSDLPDRFWEELAADLMDTRGYYVAGVGHIKPSLEEIEGSIKSSIDSYREKNKGR